MVNLNDGFDQETTTLLSDIEIFFIHCLKDAEALNSVQHDAKVGLAGIAHSSDETGLL